MLTMFLPFAGGHSQRCHALELGLLQPLFHSSECLAAGLEFGPRFWITEEVRKGALGATEHTLGEDCLRDRIALQLGRDFRRYLFCVHLNFLGYIRSRMAGMVKMV